MNKTLTLNGTILITLEDALSNTDKLSCMPSPRGAAIAACTPLPHTRGSGDRTLKCDGYSAYLISIGNESLRMQLIDYCKTIPQRLVIVTDTHLIHTLGKTIAEWLLAEKMPAALFCIPAGEINKTRETKQALEDMLSAHHYGRDTCLIAVGGGVVTDLVGFVAATYCRGIPVIYVPTTLLAMVDASIGGKTAVDTPFGKNLIGAFYQPKAVFIDVAMLHSLPDQEWRNGVVEIIKHGLINDEKLFRDLQKNVTQIKEPQFLLDIIMASCLLKKNIVEQDERELGIRKILNFGHTIGHAIEVIENYTISHGEAVAIGLIVEAYLSLLCGFLANTIVDDIEKILRDYALPLKTSAFQEKKIFKQALGLDKKALATIPYFVLLDKIGKVHCVENNYSTSVAEKILDQALDWAQEKFCDCVPAGNISIPITPEDALSNTDKLSGMPSPRGAATAACTPLPHTRARGSCDRTLQCDEYSENK